MAQSHAASGVMTSAAAAVAQLAANGGKLNAQSDQNQGQVCKKSCNNQDINTVTRDITYFKIHCSSGKISKKSCNNQDFFS